MAEKRCPRCGETKEIAGFSRSVHTKDGLNFYCKDCRKTDYRRMHPKRDPADRCGSHAGYKWHVNHGEVVCELCLIAKREHLKAVRGERPWVHQASTLRFRFGISLEDWQSWLMFQGRRCAICGTSDPGGKGWNTDHDHDCHPTKGCEKCLRGILCFRCNLGLGYLEDDPERLRAAADYLDAGGSYTAYRQSQAAGQ